MSDERNPLWQLLGRVPEQPSLADQGRVFVEGKSATECVSAPVREPMDSVDEIKARRERWRRAKADQRAREKAAAIAAGQMPRQFIGSPEERAKKAAAARAYYWKHARDPEWLERRRAYERGRAALRKAKAASCA